MTTRISRLVVIGKHDLFTPEQAQFADGKIRAFLAARVNLP